MMEFRNRETGVIVKTKKVKEKIRTLMGFKCLWVELINGQDYFIDEREFIRIK